LIHIIIEKDFRDIEAITGALKDLSGVRSAIEGITGASVRRNFEEGGRPQKWKPSLRVQKHGGKTLIQSGSLRDSCRAYFHRGSLSLSSSLPYSGIHHRGGRAGRDLKSTIPARPFLMIQPEDETAIAKVVNDFLSRKII
jgi:phage gpG-like protein